METMAHDADACGQCMFVANEECIVVTPRQRESAEITLAKKLRSRAGSYDLEDSIVFLGRFTLPRWPGHNAFWLFTCPNCQHQDVDYLHGRRLYLSCRHCDTHLQVTQPRFFAAVEQDLQSVRD